MNPLKVGLGMAVRRASLDAGPKAIAVSLSRAFSNLGKPGAGDPPVPDGKKGAFFPDDKARAHGGGSAVSSFFHKGAVRVAPGAVESRPVVSGKLRDGREVQVCQARRDGPLASKWDECTLVAIVDGEVAGVAEFNEREHDGLGEAGVPDGFLDKCRLERTKVCVARMEVDRGAEGLGIGTFLMKGLVQAAGEAGYAGVAGQTSSAAVKAIVERLGGSLEHSGGVVNEWTMLRTGSSA